MKSTKIEQIVITIAGCATVIFATWFTKNPGCLWGLLFVVWMLKATSKNAEDKDDK